MRFKTSDLGNHICLSSHAGILKLAPFSYLGLSRFKTVGSHPNRKKDGIQSVYV